MVDGQTHLLRFLVLVLLQFQHSRDWVLWADRVVHRRAYGRAR